MIVDSPSLKDAPADAVADPVLERSLQGRVLDQGSIGIHLPAADDHVSSCQAVGHVHRQADDAGVLELGRDGTLA